MRTRLQKFAIHQAKTGEERERIYSFRYEVYVAEMGRRQDHADHISRRIHEELDPTATHLYAVSATNEIIGSVRTNIVKNCGIACLGYYPDLYGIPPESLYSSSITTKLIVAKDYRKTGLALSLACAIYAVGLQENVLRDYIDCSPGVESFFLGLGYQHKSWADHPEYGQVQVMELDLTDNTSLSRMHAKRNGSDARGI